MRLMYVGKLLALGIVAVFILAGCAATGEAAFQNFRNNPAPVQNILHCIDSDGGENFEESGFIRIVTQRGWKFKKHTIRDRCTDNILTEMVCPVRGADYRVEHDCGPEATCERGACVPIPPDPCENVQCEDNHQCVEGECVFVDPCADIQCGRNEQCVEGLCEIINHPPVLDEIGNKEVDEGELLQFEVTASDQEGDELQFRTSRLPPGSTFINQIFRWIPTFEQARDYRTKFGVSDGFNSDREVITITVNNVNRAPVLDPIGNQEVDEGELLEFQVTAFDPDGNDLEYSLIGAQEGMVIEDGVFSWTPEEAGEYEVTVVVSDGELSDEKSIAITVIHVEECRVWLTKDLVNFWYYDGNEWDTVYDYYDPDMLTDTQDISVIYGTGPNDVWLSNRPDIYHFDGELWRYVGNQPSGITAFWGVSSDNLWGGGRGFHHFDGENWERSGDIQANPDDMWGSGPDDIWAVGNYIHHYDGNEWTLTRQAFDEVHRWGVRRVWGSGPNDVWAVGNAGALMHYDGNIWSYVDVGTNEALMDIWGSGPNDIWIVGGNRNSLILHYDGNEWSEFEHPRSEGLLNVWGSGPNNIIATARVHNAVHNFHTKILYFDGENWRVEENRMIANEPKNIWGSCS